jgi:two-component system chemotaxis response regulator CheB
MRCRGKDDKIRVLIVDDSLFMRRMLRRMLESHPRIAVIDEARDGVEAVAKCISLNPDVMVLDIEMPKMDGLSVLRDTMIKRPLPVVMFSSLTQRGSKITMEALSMGAVDFVPKPVARGLVPLVARELCEKVIHASCARLRVQELRYRHETERAKKRKQANGTAPVDTLVVIGSSTGGPQALEEIIPNLPPDLPAAVIICQHMPRGFTESLAQRLDMLSSLKVREAAEEDVLEPGLVLVAPGGYHLRIDKLPCDKHGVYHVYLDEGNAVHGVKPSVDVTLFDAGSLFRANLMVVILTGMGFDGARGAWAARKAGAKVICQDRETSVVWGMPKACYEAGGCEKILPLDDIANAIEGFCSKR